MTPKTRLHLLFLALAASASGVQAQTPSTPAPQGDPAGPVREQVIVDRRTEESIIVVPTFATPVAADTPAGNTNTLAGQMAKIIADDVSGTSGLTTKGPTGLRQISMGEVSAPNYSEWGGMGAEGLVQGSVRANPDGSLTLTCALFDVALKSKTMSTEFTVAPRKWRRAAHKCADAAYSSLSGESPFFDSQLVYVAETGPKGKRKKKIAIMDSDGDGHRFLTNGQNIVLTPRFSPDYKKILYLSYAGRRPQIFVLDVASGRQRLVTESPHQTFSPRWSPDGNHILYSMAVGGNTDIFMVSATGGTPVQLTNNPAIDTGGSFSPDGRRIVFESDRSGTQQIYVMNVDGSSQERISFGEGQHATPEWSPKGDLIAFTKIGGGAFRVGVMTPGGQSERVLTNAWQDEAPTWSPNGRVIQFFRTTQGTGQTSVWQVDVTGAKQRKIKTPEDASDPSWGAILKD